MAQNVADVLWEMLEKAGVKRCYGIVGDALSTCPSTSRQASPRTSAF
jgi:thiamine pyrophosphate-dependent acetolactate synthase large subunit-like protein